MAGSRLFKCILSTHVMGVIQSQNASEINEINEVLPTIRTTKIARHITII